MGEGDGHRERHTSEGCLTGSNFLVVLAGTAVLGWPLLGTHSGPAFCACFKQLERPDSRIQCA